MVLGPSFLKGGGAFKGYGSGLGFQERIGSSVYVRVVMSLRGAKLTSQWRCGVNNYT